VVGTATKNAVRSPSDFAAGGVNKRRNTLGHWGPKVKARGGPGGYGPATS